MKLPKFKLDLSTRNVGKKDSYIRIAVGALLLVGFWRGGFHNWVIALIGLGLFASAWFRVCPAYSLLGKNTNVDEGAAK